MAYRSAAYNRVKHCAAAFLRVLSSRFKVELRAEILEYPESADDIRWQIQRLLQELLSSDLDAAFGYLSLAKIAGPGHAEDLLGRARCVLARARNLVLYIDDSDC